MIAVIFEVWPRPEHREDYLEHARAMRELVEAHHGFVSVERFESLYEDGKLLSLSFFDSEESLDRWRQLPAHRAMQEMGRQQMFADYRLRIARVLRDYGMTRREEAPPDSRERHG